MLNIYDSVNEAIEALAAKGITLDVSDEVLNECVFFYEEDGWYDYRESKKLDEYREKCEAGEGDWSFYSDWYKDVYGFRPRW